MSNQKTYSIKFQGVKESISDTETLIDTLKKLKDATDNLTKEQINLIKEQQKASKTSDELSKTTKKLEDYDKAYQLELAKTKQALAEKNKEIKAEIASERDLAIISENNTSTYAKTQELLSAIGRVMKSTNNSTEEGKQQIAEYQKRYSELNDTLKGFDSTIGNHQRNVGNYLGSLNGMKVTINGVEQEFNSAKEAVKSMEKALYTMALNGEKDTEAYAELEKKLIDMKQALRGVQSEVDTAIKKSSKLQEMIDIATTATSALGLWKSSLTALGVENEEVAETIEKLQAVQTALNSLQAINQQLADRSSGTYALYNKILKVFGIQKKEEVATTNASTTAQQANTAATKGATMATKGLGLALKALGIGLIISAVTYLIANWKELTKTFKDFIGVSDGGFDEFVAKVYGVGNAIKEYMLMPMNALVGAFKSIMNGDFQGAYDSVISSVKKGFDVVANYEKGVNDKRVANAKELAKKQIEENIKVTESVIAENEAKYGSDWKYTREGKKLYRELANAKLELYKEDKEEFAKAQNEKYKLEREFTERANEEAKKRKENEQKWYSDSEKYHTSIVNKEIENSKKQIENERKLLNERKVNNQIELEDTVSKYDELLTREKMYSYDKFNLQLENAEKEQNKRLETLRKEVQDRTKYNELKLKYELDYSDELLAIEKNRDIEIQKLEESTEQILTNLRKSYNEKRLKEEKETIDKQIDNISDALSQANNSPEIVKNKLSLIDVEATEKNFKEAIESFRNIAKSIDIDGVTAEWNKYLENVKNVYGEDSDAYKNAQKEKETSLLKLNETQKKALSEQTKLENKLKETNKQFVKELSKTVTEMTGKVTDSVDTIFKMQLDNANNMLDKLKEKSSEVESKANETADKIKSLSDKYKEATGEEREALKQQIAEEQVILAQRNAEKQRLDEEAYRIEKKNKKRELYMNMVQTASSIATGIAQDLSKGIPLGPIFAAITTGLGAVQIANSISQYNKLENGGLLNGKRHSQGGMKVEGTNIEVEGGEFVVNRKSTAKYLPLLQSINNEYATPNHTRKYAEGGKLDFNRITNMVDNTSQLSVIQRQIASLDLQPVVSVVDINRVNKNLTKVQQLAGK